MKIFIFNREKFIKEGLDWYNKCVEIDKYCNVKTRPREEVIKELGFKVSRDKDYKVDVILYKDMFIGCIE